MTDAQLFDRLLTKTSAAALAVEKMDRQMHVDAQMMEVTIVALREGLAAAQEIKLRMANGNEIRDTHKPEPPKGAVL